MADWREKLTGLGKQLEQKEQAVADQQAAQVAEFRRILLAIDPVGQEVALLADAYGVDCEWEVYRFDARHPGFRFRTLRPLSELAVECRSGQVFMRQGARETSGKLADITPEAVKDQLMNLVLAAAQAVRKPPGGRR